MADDVSSTTLPMRVLDSVFQQTGDDLAVPAAVSEIRRQLGTDARTVAAAVKKLARRQLVEQTAALSGDDGPSQVFITREGAKLAAARAAARSGIVAARIPSVAGPGTASMRPELFPEQKLAPPWRRTTPVPLPVTSTSNVMVTTGMYPVAPAGRQSTADADHFTDTAARQLRRFFDGYEKYEQYLRDEMGHSRADGIADDVDTLRVQIGAHRPNPHVIRALTDSIRTKLEKAEDGVVVFGLLHIVGEIRV